MIKNLRSTDNAWIETSVLACEEKSDDPIDFDIKAGDDAQEAFWRIVSDDNITRFAHLSILKNFINKIQENS